jgi:hypothetical protein
MTQSRSSRSPSLRRRATASLAGGAVVSAVAGLTVDPSAGLLVGVCVSGVLFRDSATYAPLVTRLRTGVLVGLAVGLVNAVSASISHGWVDGVTRGAAVAGAVGVSLGLVWFLAGAILAVRAAHDTQRTSTTARLLIRGAVKIAGSEVITAEGCGRELDDQRHSRAAQRQYARGVFRAAAVGRLLRIAGKGLSALDWVLRTDLRFYGFTLAPSVSLAAYLGLDFQNLVAVGTVVLFTGEALRDLRNIKPKRLGRPGSRH